jgi:hypothetical protein
MNAFEKFAKKIIFSRFQKKVRAKYPQYADLNTLTLNVAKHPGQENKYLGKLYVSLVDGMKDDYLLNDSDIEEYRALIPVGVKVDSGKTVSGTIIELNYITKTLYALVTYTDNSNTKFTY